MTTNTDRETTTCGMTKERMKEVERIMNTLVNEHNMSAIGAYAKMLTGVVPE